MNRKDVRPGVITRLLQVVSSLFKRAKKPVTYDALGVYLTGLKVKID